MRRAFEAARHERRDEPNEDAVGTRTTDSMTAVAVADGHGSERCDRAARGAALAVSIVLDLLVTQPAVPAEAFGRRLHADWREAVDADLRHDPIQDPGGGTTRHERYLRYGTTIVAAAAGATRLRIVQLGDGDALLARAGSGWTGRPIEKRPGVQPWETASLCQDNAGDETVIVDLDLTNDPVDVCLLATDGLDATFADPEWHDATMHDLVGRLARLRPDDLDTAVREWCVPPAAVGGDDTSIALLVCERATAADPTNESEPHQGVMS